MRSLIAIDIHGADAFPHALERIWADGDAVLPVDTRAPLPYLRWLLESQRPAAVEFADGTREALANPVPINDGDAAVITTSGTTGEPKGVVHTHDSIRAAATMTGAATASGPESHWLACLPLSHVGGFSVVTRALLNGSRLSVHDGFSAEPVDAAPLSGATHVSLVTTALRRIDASRWKMILLGGSAIPSDRPANSVATYGMTETFGGVVYDGHALSGVDIRISTDSQIELRSPSLLSSYRTTNGVHMEAPLTSDGYYRTGDVGAVTEESGLLEVYGRSDDVIITGGVKIWPETVEIVVSGHPLVGECVVVGRDDPDWGQAVVAVIVPRDPEMLPSLAELRELVKGALPREAAPQELVVSSALPRTRSGKVRRKDVPLP